MSFAVLDTRLTTNDTFSRLPGFDLKFRYQILYCMTMNELGVAAAATWETRPRHSVIVIVRVREMEEDLMRVIKVRVSSDTWKCIVVPVYRVLYCTL